MKKAVIMTVLWLLPSGVGAQPESSVAFKGGPNAATTAEPHRYNIYGFSGGLAGDLRWRLVDRFSLAGQIELLYTTRGDVAIFDGEYLGRLREHCIDLMFAARPTARLGNASVYLLLGGGLGFLVNAWKEDAGTVGDITGDLRRFDLMLLAGAGVALHLPARELGPFRLGAVFLEGRYDLGLIDTDAVNGGFKNRDASLMLGMSFALASRAAGTPPPGRHETTSAR